MPSFKGASTHILGGLRFVLNKHEVILHTLGESELPPRSGFLHRPWHIKEENFLHRALAFRQRVDKALKDNRPDLLHFRGIWEGIPCVNSGLPTVYEVNALPSIELHENYPHLSSRFLELIWRDEHECLTKASSIIVPSALIANCLQQEHQIGSNRIQVMPNGHDLHLSSKRIANTSNSKLRMVYLGTLHPWQGLLWSIPHLKVFEEQMELDIFGADQKTWSDYFHKRVRKHGLQNMIKHHGPLMRPHFHSVLASYDLGFAPFLQTVRNVRQGAHPVKLLDYLSHGLPVLAADLPLARQLVDDGINGLFFKPQGHKELELTLQRLIDDRNYLESLALGASRKAQDLPNWEDYSKRLVQIYERLANNEFIALR